MIYKFLQSGKYQIACFLIGNDCFLMSYNGQSV